MTFNELSDVTNLTYSQLLQAKLREIPNEDPTKFFKYMYSTIHPGMINLAVKDAKKALAREQKKTGQFVNVYLTLGSDGMTESLYTGCIGALLWLQEYIDIAQTSFNCTKAEVETTKQVLRKIGLPHVTDVGQNDKGEIIPRSTCKHYASFLGSFVQWLTTGVTSFKVDGKMKSNMELCRFLSSLSLNSFPSIPFTAYYIGTIKNNDPMTLAERMSKIVDFNKFMTAESFELNQPKFIVQTENTPLVGISGHPLANIIYGQENNGNVEWFGLFQDSDEFNRICVKNGVSSKDVKKYIYQTSWNDHQKKISEGDKMALFIQSQNFIKEVFELRHSEYNIEPVEDKYEID